MYPGEVGVTREGCAHYAGEWICTADRAEVRRGRECVGRLAYWIGMGHHLPLIGQAAEVVHCSVQIAVQERLPIGHALYPSEQEEGDAVLHPCGCSSIYGPTTGLIELVVECRRR